MSGLEVAVAVSAVISAFHGGSELFKHIKKKYRTRKARDQAQEWEEKQLQDSLITGEQQISMRYKQDLRELGDLMRVGDVIARDRLFHIAIQLQAEVIKSLQLAATHDNIPLNIRLLYETSIWNKQGAIVTLDELKQRILTTRPMARQLEGEPEALRPWQSTAPVQTIRAKRHSPPVSAPNDYGPPVVTLPAQSDSRESKHGLTEYFRMKRNRSTSAPSASAQSNTPTQPANVNFSAALEELVRSRGSEPREVILQDIDAMISSYGGLNASNGPSRPWDHNQYNESYLGRRDTLIMLNAGDSYTPKHDGTQMFNNQPLTTEGYIAGAESVYSPYNHNVFDAQQEQRLHGQQYAARSVYPQIQTQTSPSRWSNASGTSSTSSNAASLNRNSSSSSQGSNMQPSPLPFDYPHPDYSCTSPVSVPPNALYQQHAEVRRVQPPSSPYATSEARHTPPIAPLAPKRTGIQPARKDAPAYGPAPSHEGTSPPMHTPWPGSQEDVLPMPLYKPPQQYPAAIEEEVDVFEPTRPLNRPTPPTARNSDSMYSSTSERTITPSMFPTVSTAATSLIAMPAVAGPRHTSIGSIASIDSGVSVPIGILPGNRMRTNIRTDTIQSAPAGKEKMMDGRPKKDNNYWGFCKGAWDVREDPQKGISIRTQPSGLYASRQIWECKECTFKGDVFSAPHPTKKGRTESVVDPRIHISMAGVRYRWIFLAKSHVKKKLGDSFSDMCNYGCVFCSVEGNVTGVYGGVETLMNHIALTHIAGMSDKTRKKVNCILGRVAPANEEFDINVPIFAQVEELAG